MSTLTASAVKIQRLNPADLTVNEKTFQKMPSLSDVEFTSLKADIEANGVMVPIEVTIEGVVLDGHHRVKIARELKLDTIPAVVKKFKSEDEAVAHVFAVNLQRRHLNRSQKAALTRAYLKLNPYDSNRAVAAKLGGAVDDKTVGERRKEMEESGDITKTTKRIGRDKKVRPAKNKSGNGQSVASLERKRQEQTRNQSEALRLGVQEVSRYTARGLDVAAVVSATDNAPKKRENLIEHLRVTLPFLAQVAYELGVEWDLPQGSVIEVGTEENTEEAPF